MKEELDKRIIYFISRYIHSLITSPISNALFKGDIRIDKQRDLWKHATITFVEDTHRFQIKKLP